MLHCLLQSHSDDGGFIARSDGVSTWVTFKYERLPMCCHYCGMIRHDLRHCATHFAIEKDGKKVEYQYGDWLKAMGVAKARPPFRRGVGKYFGSADVKDGILEQSTNHQLEFGELAATMKSDTEKPGLCSCHDEGISVISGAVPNFQ